MRLMHVEDEGSSQIKGQMFRESEGRRECLCMTLLLYIVHSLDVHACLRVVHCSMPVWGFDTSGPGTC